MNTLTKQTRKQPFSHHKIMETLRHQMTRRELDSLYCKLCDFLADCTKEEVEEYRDSIVKIKTLIHYRMQGV